MDRTPRRTGTFGLSNSTQQALTMPTVPRRTQKRGLLHNDKQYNTLTVLVAVLTDYHMCCWPTAITPIDPSYMVSTPQSAFFFSNLCFARSHLDCISTHLPLRKSLTTPSTDRIPRV